MGTETQGAAGIPGPPARGPVSVRKPGFLLVVDALVSSRGTDPAFVAGAPQ